MLLEILRIGGHPQMLRHAGRQEPVFATPHGLDIKALGAERDVERTRTIAREGTSAERQEDTYREALLDGAEEHEALKAVVDQIRTETEDG